MNGERPKTLMMERMSDLQKVIHHGARATVRHASA